MLTRRTLFAAVAGSAAALNPHFSLPAVATKSRPLPLRFPRPTGPYSVGTTELHLVDQDRDDPLVPGRARELMISLWYPSAGASAQRAPYLPPLTADLYGAGAAWFQRHFPVPPELIANTIGTADPIGVLRSLRTYVPAFFDQHLRGRPGDWRNSPRHPDIRFIA